MSDFVKFCSHYEGRHNKMYKCPAGYWTAGIGRKLNLGQIIEYKDKVVPEDVIDKWFAQDDASCEAAVTELVKRKITEGMRLACKDFIFNLGKGAFKGSTFLKKLNSGDFKGASLELLRWNKARDPKNGQLRPLAGLTARCNGRKFMFDGGSLTDLEHKHGWFQHG